MIVAIDGPAGSGKGTVTKIIAQRLGLINIDTGAMYRCVALASLKNNLSINKEKEISELIDDLKIDFKYTETDDIKVFMNDVDVTKEIRSIEVNKIVSQVSSIIDVRLKLVELQRKMAIGKDVIMEGRDIGTYVFPNADVKIYLDADINERANRRLKENIEKGIECNFEDILNNIRRRDENDKNKKIGALKVADDAIIVNSTNLTIDGMADKVEKVILSKKNEEK